LANNFYPVILAGGRGTRFWPLSRKRRAKQLLPLNSKKSMIQETVERLLPLAKAKQFWVITNDDLRDPIVRQLKKLNKRHVLAEPVGRNTAPAIGLAAFLLERRDPAAVLGLFPSDHVIFNEKRFRADIQRAVEIAAAGENIVVIGIKPTRAETGYGYIEVSAKGALTKSKGRPSAAKAGLAGLDLTDGLKAVPFKTDVRHLRADSRKPTADSQEPIAKSQEPVLTVRRFTEKPNADVAEQFVRAGNFFWNSGMFIWGAKTLADALREHLPKTAPLLEEIAASYGTRRFEKTFAKLYPKCENISVDYAVLEPRSAKGEGRSGIYCIPAGFGWNDLGSWAALYEHRNSSPQQAQQRRLPGSGNKDGANVIVAEESFTLNAEGNFIHTNGKFVAVVGVQNLVVVETDDALLITTREHSQDVGKVVKHLDEKKMKRLV
jgi:mannose-1-phosphate guanylyltransferase